MILQTAGLVGTETELCAVCYGEGRPQGHVHQERGRQCAQQQQVGLSVTFKRQIELLVVLFLLYNHCNNQG